MLEKMQIPLLQTKLSIPPPRSNLVPRQRLTELLDAGQRRKLTLISAPPGFGKTTLVSNWIYQLDEPGGQASAPEEFHPSSLELPLPRVAWVSLDEQDNDPARFWQYVIAALQNLNAALGEHLPGAFQASQPPPLEAILTLLINNLAAYQPASDQLLPLLLILDDYHVITSDAIHDGLNFLIDHQPSTLHIVITTRSDPPLQLSRRQGRSEITQIRASELSFNNAEAEEFLNSLMGLNLSGNDVTALKSRTEGWIAGLQLAALSLQDQEDRHTFVTAFAGDDRHIADYLVDEVLRHQPMDVQFFLLRTSILDRLCAPLCDALTGRSESQTILISLERANLFLTPLDNRREWYRYHQLFADLLRQRLRESSSEEDIALLHRQAFEWYAERGEIIDAINHALLAGNHQDVALLIEQQAQEIFGQFKLNTLTKWIQALPEDFVSNRPKLSMIYAWALLATGQLEEVERSLQSIESSMDASAEVVATADWYKLDPEVKGALAEVIVIRSALSISQFEIDKALELCQWVLPYLNDNSQPFLFNEPLSLRTVVLFNMGIASEYNGEGALAEEALSEAVRLSLEQRNINILPAAMAHLAQLQVVQGQLHQAHQTYRRAIRLASEYSDWPSPMAGAAEIGLGNLYYEWNDLERSLRHLNAGISLAERWNHVESLQTGYIGLAKLKHALGDESGAEALLEELARTLQQFEGKYLLPAVDASRARLWIAQSKLATANSWLQTSNLMLDGEFSYFQENDYLIVARLLIAQDRWEEADRLTARLLEFAEEGARRGRVIEVSMLRALVLMGQGKSVRAQETLSNVLAEAEPEGYVRLFIDEGPPMAQLLFRVAANSTKSSYINRLLDLIDVQVASEGDKPEYSESQPVEPLSNREIEVLECIDEGLSNREIAQRLTISLSTVKSHTRNIYGKLGVNSRTQALAYARAWGILTST